MIQLNNVTKRYRLPDKDVHAVREVSLSINRREIFGVIGLSGAGKSTLVRLLNRLEEVDKGEVKIDGVQLSTLPQKELRQFRRKVGMIFQHFQLLRSRTVWGNVALPLELGGWKKEDIHKRVAEVIALVGLCEQVKQYPSQLSGGQKQRVAIARALATKPDILLSDEATSALDPETTRSILQLLRQINKKTGITIVLITHAMDVIDQICNRVAIMESGEIVELGDVTQVFSNPQSRTGKSFLRKETKVVNSCA